MLLLGWKDVAVCFNGEQIEQNTLLSYSNLYLGEDKKEHMKNVIKIGKLLQHITQMKFLNKLALLMVLILFVVVNMLSMSSIK